MSGPEPQPPPGDPSMEDILASIRRILADGEDSAPQAGAAGDANAGHGSDAQVSSAQVSDAQVSSAQVFSAHVSDAQVFSAHVSNAHVSNASEPTAIDDVFVLDQTMLIEEPAPMPPDTEQPHVADAREPPPDFSHLDAGAPLLDPGAAAAAGAHFGALARAAGTRHMPVYRNGPTLEDIVREEMRPLVKDWLDEHLAPLVERLVRAEIERLAVR